MTLSEMQGIYFVSPQSRSASAERMDRQPRWSNCRIVTFVIVLLLFSVITSLSAYYAVDYRLTSLQRHSEQSRKHEDGRILEMQLQLQRLNKELQDAVAILHGQPVTAPSSTVSVLDNNTEKEVQKYRDLLAEFRTHLKDLRIEGERITQHCEDIWTNITQSDSSMLTNDIVKSLLELHSTMESHKGAIQKLLRSQIDNSIFASSILPPVAISRINSYFSQKSIVPLRISLLFRASENGFSANAFHHHCDNKGPTLVVAKSKADAENPSGRIFGGFTFANWSRVVQEKREGSPNDFLFSLDWEDLLPIWTKYNSGHSNSIFTADYMGPQFGQSPELKLSDQCDEYNNSVSILGKSTRTFKEPDGSTSFVKGGGGFFLCEDYEVYSVSIYT